MLWQHARYTPCNLSRDSIRSDAMWVFKVIGENIGIVVLISILVVLTAA